MTSQVIQHKDLSVGRKTSIANEELKNDIIFFHCFCGYKFETLHHDLQNMKNTINEHLAFQHTIMETVGHISESLILKISSDVFQDEI